MGAGIEDVGGGLKVVANYGITKKHLTHAVTRTSKLTYVEPIQCDEIGRGSARKRNNIWSTPSFSKNVATNVGKYFLNLINKHFPKNHKFSKIFNKNTLKLSSSCMANIKSVLNAHNRKVTTTEIRENIKLCNYNVKEDCQ